MTDLGNRYALSALRAKRGELAGEIAQLKKKLAWAEDSLRHIDASLAILDPARDPAEIPAKRPQKRVKLFRQGQLGALILAALRQAKTPQTTGEVVTAVLAACGHGEGARPGLAPRVRGNLAYLEGAGRVKKLNRGRQARWAINPGPAVRLAFAT
ncbi:MAG TPA: hypothetical protein VG798_03710 [Rhizomicrobium sp.]|nr:hypothetical protein [Rhizomicrobium sp.]